MAIREVHLGIEAVYNVAATTFVFERVNDLAPKNNAPLDKPRETSGTTIVLQRARLKGRQFDFTVKTYGYFDMTCYWLALAFGVPTITPVASATGAFDHIFKPGSAVLKSATLRWKQVSSAGTLWFQAVGCKLNSVKFGLSANGMPMWEFAGHGKYATNISAPSAVSDTTANYVQPIDMSQQALTMNASAWLLPKKMDLTITNGLGPDWGVAATRDFNRLKMGDTAATASIEAFMDAYATSMTAIEDSTNSLMNAVVYTAVDTTTLFGTPTPVSPQMIIALPKPYVDNVSQDNTNTDTEEKGAVDLAYDSASATLATITLRNALSLTTYTGT